MKKSHFAPKQSCQQSTVQTFKTDNTPPALQKKLSLKKFEIRQTSYSQYKKLTLGSSDQSQLIKIQSQKRHSLEHRSLTKIFHRKKIVTTHINSKLLNNDKVIQSQNESQKKYQACKQIISIEKQLEPVQLIKQMIKQKTIKLYRQKNIIQVQFNKFEAILYQFNHKTIKYQKFLQKEKQQKQALKNILKTVLPKQLQVGKKSEQSEVQMLKRQIKNYGKILNQYRFDNPAAIAQFQKKIKQYKPSCQNQLLIQIAQKNKENKILEYQNIFLKQKMKNIKSVNPHLNIQAINKEMQNSKNLHLIVLQQRQQNQRLTNQLTQKKNKIEQLISFQNKYYQQIKKIEYLQQRTLNLSYETQIQKKIYQQQKLEIIKLEEDLNQKQKKLENINYELHSSNIKINNLTLLKNQNTEKILKLQNKIIQINNRIENITQKNLELKTNLNNHSLNKKKQQQQLIQIVQIIKKLEITLKQYKKGDQQRIIFINHLIKRLCQAYQQLIIKQKQQIKNLKKERKLSEQGCQHLITRQKINKQTVDKRCLQMIQFIQINQNIIEKMKKHKDIKIIDVYIQKLDQNIRTQIQKLNQMHLNQ